MTIAKGDRIPNEALKLVTTEGAREVRANEFFEQGRSILIGIPGAFTPTCSDNHLPGYLENRDAILELGVRSIAVVSVNDHFVMSAWARTVDGVDSLAFLADGNGEFTRKIGMETDMTAEGLGTRSQRFSMIIEDGVVVTVNTGDAPGQAEQSGAERILEQLLSLSC